MINIALASNSSRNERHAANFEAHIPKSDEEISTMLVSVVERTWMLTIGYSAFHYTMAKSLARHNVETLAAFTDALGSLDAGDKFKGKRGGLVEGSTAPSLEDLLASDRRSIECKALVGEFWSNPTMSLRRNLILASSVVC